MIQFLATTDATCTDGSLSSRKLNGTASTSIRNACYILQKNIFAIYHRRSIESSNRSRLPVRIFGCNHRWMNSSRRESSLQSAFPRRASQKNRVIRNTRDARERTSRYLAPTIARVSVQRMLSQVSGSRCVTRPKDIVGTCVRHRRRLMKQRQVRNTHFYNIRLLGIQYLT